MSVKQSQQQLLLDNLFARLKNTSQQSSPSENDKEPNKPGVAGVSFDHLSLIFSCGPSAKNESATKTYINDIITNLVQTAEAACEEFENALEKDEHERNSAQKEKTSGSNPSDAGEREQEEDKKRKQLLLMKSLLLSNGEDADEDESKRSSKKQKFLPPRPATLKNYSLPLHHSQLFTSSTSHQHPDLDHNNGNSNSNFGGGYFEYRSINIVLPMSEVYENLFVEKNMKKTEGNEKVNQEEDEDEDEKHNDSSLIRRNQILTSFATFFAPISVDIYFTLLPSLIQSIIVKQHQQLHKKRIATFPMSKPIVSLTCLFTCFDLSDSSSTSTNGSQIIAVLNEHKKITRKSMFAIRSLENTSNNNNTPLQNPDEKENVKDEHNDDEISMQDSFSIQFEDKLTKSSKMFSSCNLMKVHDEVSKNIQLRNDHESNFFPSLRSLGSSNENSDFYVNVLVGFESELPNEVTQLRQQLLRRVAMQSSACYVARSISSKSVAKTATCPYIFYMMNLVFFSKRNHRDESSFERILIQLGQKDISEQSSRLFFAHFTDSIGLLENSAARGTNLSNFVEGDLKNAEMKLGASSKQENQLLNNWGEKIVEHEDMMKQLEKKLLATNNADPKLKNNSVPNTGNQQQQQKASEDDESLWDEF